MVTAQKRAVGLQDSSLSIAAVTGDKLEANGIYNAEDLAKSVTGFSMTGGAFDLELNMRGITNTRLDSPTADPSVGMFVDDVYVGRMGLMSPDFFDLERVEVIRGPQGVLLGKNVVGGALSIFSAKPQFEREAKFTVLGSNYDGLGTRGYFTGALTDKLAGRVSFQTRDRAGYAEDVVNGRELEDLNSVQARAQLLYEDDERMLTARLIAEYSEDSGNGINRHPVKQPGTEPFALGQWSNVHEGLGLDERQSAVGSLPYVDGEERSTVERESYSVILNVEKEFASELTLTSITGYRAGNGESRYSQTGVSYDAVAAISPGLEDLIPFIEPVWEQEDIEQFSQELRVTSNYSQSNWDWLVGAYYQRDENEKFDRFTAQNKLLGVPGLSGESHWLGEAENTTQAVFAQLGYRFNEQWKLTAGARYTRDEKSGQTIAIARTTGDKFNPPDGVPAVPLVTSPGYDVSYSEEWSELTPQLTLEYTPFDDLLTYVSATRGFKGGGFEDTPPNAVAAALAFDPELVTSIEIGAKYDFWDGRMRINGAVFDMDYTDLQVSQTNGECLCNVTENAADASIRGVELEMLIAASESLVISLSGSYLDTEYVDFIESNGTDNSGNRLQRTPQSQFNVGIDYSADLGSWSDALRFNMNYTWQDKMYWGPQNTNSEDSYGLLDARVTLAPYSKPWTISAWGKNLSDEVYRSNITAIFNDEISVYTPPRTYGVEFSWSF
ncbi:TonB-dependent receptor [Seongchinamella sediminis]|uniref:TonB-dependent receptor n=1 Tax=Seongchinamella sediminis TaxID=2283635 RepID=UPI0013C332A4|nr:TonB-dependent receptor [Seongchinamella sediminis]